MASRYLVAIDTQSLLIGQHPLHDLKNIKKGRRWIGSLQVEPVIYDEVRDSPVSKQPNESSTESQGRI